MYINSTFPTAVEVQVSVLAACESRMLFYANTTFKINQNRNCSIISATPCIRTERFVACRPCALMYRYWRHMSSFVLRCVPQWSMQLLCVHSDTHDADVAAEWAHWFNLNVYQTDRRAICADMSVSSGGLLVCRCMCACVQRCAYTTHSHTHICLYGEIIRLMRVRSVSQPSPPASPIRLAGSPYARQRIVYHYPDRPYRKII